MGTGDALWAVTERTTSTWPNQRIIPNLPLRGSATSSVVKGRDEGAESVLHCPTLSRENARLTGAFIALSLLNIPYLLRLLRLRARD